MNNEELTDQEDPLQITVRCPYTQTQITVDREKLVYIQEEQVAWWQCPACHGWHILLQKNNRDC